MSPRSLAAVVAVALLLVGALPAAALGTVAPGQSARADGAAAMAAPHNSSLDPGDVEMRVELAADGDARWRVMTVVAVTDDDERAAFADLVEQFNRSQSPLGLDGFRASAENVSRATGRDMAITDVERHHALHNETGALWVTFTWTNFGQRVGDRLRVDDGFNTSTGVWLPLLSEQETLVIVPPPGYGVSSAPTGSQSAPTTLTNGVARWEGPQDFGDRGPWIVYSGDAQTPPPTTNPGTVTSTNTPGGPTTSATGPPDGNGDGPFSGALPLVVVAVLLAAVAAGFVAYTRGGDDDGRGGISGGTGGDTGAASPDSTTEPDGPAAEPASGDGGGTASTDGETDAADATAAAGGAAAEADDAADDGIDEELLSDEERVERLIEQNGGRMKQAAIVQETGWSNAKVSQLLSSMDEEGRIDKLRIGRENLISFPDEDVADLDSE